MKKTRLLFIEADGGICWTLNDHRQTYERDPEIGPAVIDIYGRKRFFKDGKEIKKDND